jgi:hypothetical protein
MNSDAKKAVILSVFQNTSIDHLFISAANMLGYSKYYTNLIDLDDMTPRQLTICYNRTCKVCMMIYKILGN